MRKFEGREEVGALMMDAELRQKYAIEHAKADRLPVDTSQPVPEWIQLVPPFEYGIDPNDGFHYTLLEFRQHYGDYDGLRELWEMFAILATLAID